MKLHYGWVVVAVGAVLGCVAVGPTFSLAVFLQPMADATGWSRTGISTAMTIVFLMMGSYFFTRALDEFYAVVIVFGFTYGGVMPLYAVIAREYFPMRIMGTVFGAATMVSAFGMAFGPALGGWIFDTTGGYGWLYIGSFGIGLAAAAIALAFPPAPLAQRSVAQAA